MLTVQSVYLSQEYRWMILLSLIGRLRNLFETEAPFTFYRVRVLRSDYSLSKSYKEAQFGEG